jgi:predicted nucleic acid-binding protein
MGAEPPVAVLDANVLFPFLMGHILSYATFLGLIDGRWTDEIEREWVENAVEFHGEVERQGIEGRRDAMNRAMPHAKIAGHQRRIDSIAFADPDDAHVIAAAIEAGADFIITCDRAFLETGALSGYPFSALHPDALLSRIMERERVLFVEMIESARRSLRNTDPTLPEYVAMIEQTGLPLVAGRLRELIVMKDDGAMTWQSA